jgi:ATP/maltotriose-dependent transcriptional regulator MalT
MTTTTNILIVDDHSMVRKGLSLLIESEEGLRVIGEASDGKEAIDLVRELVPDIVVMDISMPNLNGIDATREIIAESPQTRVVALSCHSGKQYVESMLEAGAAGYLLKEGAPDELIKAINVVKEGKAYLSAEITDIVLSRLRQTPRAKEVLTADSHLVVSKLQRPVLASTIVHRSELIRKLEAGREKLLTVIAAPVGYGKSTLASDWLAHCNTPSTWLTLDEEDNDLRRFLEYLLEAIRALNPGACPNVQSLAEAANLPPTSILAKTLANDLEQVTQHFILTLDNFHLIENKSIHDLLSKLLKLPLSSMHLVLIGCRDPFLPLSTLRANNVINELRIKDLSFSVAETTTFLERALQQDIDPKIAAFWTEKTDGWVTGLQLAPYTIQNSDVVDEHAPGETNMEDEASEELAGWRELLTNREYEILLLLKQRLHDKEIADQMCISMETVKSHTKNIRKKLNVISRREAVAKAIELKFLSPS